jgi:hypothetical protein
MLLFQDFWIDSIPQPLLILKGNFVIFITGPISTVSLSFTFPLPLSNVFAYIKKRC